MAFLQGLIMAFREGLEALLIIKIIKGKEPKNAYLGGIFAIFFSLLFGFGIFYFSLKLDKIWEAIASIFAVLLIIPLIISMIKNRNFKIKQGHLFWVSFLLIAREGVEIVLFTFAGKYPIISVLIGLIFSILLIALGNFFRKFFSLKQIFTLTMGFLILQVGYLFGYGIHEFVNVAKIEVLQKKAFDFSSTLLDHKKGVLGVVLNLIGWHSNPEYIQLIVQYSLTLFLFIYWRSHNLKNSMAKKV